MLIYFSILVFILGAIIASYINVVRVRGSWKSASYGRSKCDNCSNQLTYKQLIPIFSYIFYKCRCAFCGKKVSIEYLLIELALGMIFLLGFYYLPFYNFLIYAVVSVFLVPIVFSDIKSFDVPSHLVIPLIVFGVSIGVIELLFFGNFYNIVYGALLSIPFLFLHFITKGKGMGLGDFQVALPIGITLSSLSEVYDLFFLTFYLALIGIVFIYIFNIFRNKMKITIKTAIPLVPFMALSYYLIILTDFSIIGFFVPN